MEDKIIDVKESLGEGIITYKDGSKVPNPIKTIETYYESGRKDCKVVILKSIDSRSEKLDLK